MNYAFLSQENDSGERVYKAGSAASAYDVTLEDKMFGASFSKANIYKTRDISKGTVLVSAFIVLTSAFIFFLGVVIVIKYKTLPLEFSGKMVCNSCIIVFCIMLAFYLHKLNLRLYKYVCKNSTGAYSRLVNLQFMNGGALENIEMQQDIKRND